MKLFKFRISKQILILYLKDGHLYVESITITNEHNVTLLDDVIRDSDLKAKDIIIYAGQDFVLEQ